MTLNSMFIRQGPKEGGGKEGGGEVFGTWKVGARSISPPTATGLSVLQPWSPPALFPEPEAVKFAHMVL